MKFSFRHSIQFLSWLVFHETVYERPMRRSGPAKRVQRRKFTQPKGWGRLGVLARPEAKWQKIAVQQARDIGGQRQARVFCGRREAGLCPGPGQSWRGPPDLPPTHPLALLAGRTLARVIPLAARLGKCAGSSRLNGCVTALLPTTNGT